MISSGGKGLVGYLGIVVVPVLIAVSLGSLRWVEHSDMLGFDRYQHAVDGASVLLARSMGETRREFAARAPIVEVSPPYAPAVEAALAGDTVAGLASTETSLEMTVVIADSAGIVRMIREPFAPRFLEVLPRFTSMGVSIYMRGRRYATTTPPLGPEELDASTVSRLASDAAGVPYAEGGVRGMFGGIRSPAGTEPELVLLVGEVGVGKTRTLWLFTLLPILGIILFLALTAAWTMVRSATAAAKQTPPFAQSALIALIPVLAGGAILLAFDRGFRDEVVEAGRTELSESALMVRELELPLSSDLIHEVTGLDVAIMGPGGIEATTVAAPETLDAISQLKLPPPRFMSSGIAQTSLGPVFYEVVRVGANHGLILMRTDLPGRIASLRASLLRISIIMFVPALLFLTIGGIKERVPRPGQDGPSDAANSSPHEDT